MKGNGRFGEGGGEMYENMLGGKGVRIHEETGRKRQISNEEVRVMLCFEFAC